MRRRPHPARRARRVVGTISVGAYAAVGVVVGLAQRASDPGAQPEPDQPTEAGGPVDGIQRVDLTGAATFVAPATGLGPTSVPAPPPPPSVIVTTTLAPPTTTAARPVATAAPPPTTAVLQGPSPTEPVAPPTTTAAPITTVAPTTLPPTTMPPTTTQAPMPTIPTTTVPNGAS